MSVSASPPSDTVQPLTKAGRPESNALRRPRLMLFTDSFIHGGTERQFVQALRHLNHLKYEVLVGCLKRRGPFLAEAEALTIPIFEFPTTSLRHWSTVQWLRRTARFLREQHVDLVHAFDFYTTLLCVPAARLAGVPVFASRRDVMRNDTWPLRLLLGGVCRLADGVVVNSRAAGTPLAKHARGLTARVHLVQNSVDLSAFGRRGARETARCQLGFGADDCVIGIVSALRPEKQVETFVRAAAAAALEIPETRFLVIGGGTEQTRLETLATELRISDRLVFLGDRPDIPTLLPALDVFVLSSSTESSPNAVLEAMAAGKPVVATRAGGTPELVEDGVTGYLVPVGDAEAMAQRIVELLRNPEQHRAMGEAGRSRAEREFTSARMKQKLETLYDDLLRRRKIGARARDVDSGANGGQSYDPLQPCTGGATLTTRPRIAIVAPSLDILGGQGIQACALIEGLRGDGYRVSFVPINSRFPAGLRWLRRFPYARTLVNHLFYVPGLFRLRYADAVHIFSASYWSFLLAPVPAIIAARVLRRRVILNYRSGEANDHLSHWGILVHPWLRLTDEIVVPSEYLRGVFARHGYRARVVRNVVDTSAFRYRDRIPLRPRLLSTRNFGTHYRVENTLEAFTLVKARYPEATLTVAGYGNEEGRLRRLAASLGTDGIRFVGRVEPPKMPSLYAEAAIFVNSSVVDNQPVSVLEAFAAGLPVVSTETGDIPAMVHDGETGLLVPPEDPAAMAKAVISLLDDPNRAVTIARRAREEVEKYTWGRVREEWASVYSGKVA